MALYQQKKHWSYLVKIILPAMGWLTHQPITSPQFLLVNAKQSGLCFYKNSDMMINYFIIINNYKNVLQTVGTVRVDINGYIDGQRFDKFLQEYLWEESLKNKKTGIAMQNLRLKVIFYYRPKIEIIRTCWLAIRQISWGSPIITLLCEEERELRHRYSLGLKVWIVLIRILLF